MAKNKNKSKGNNQSRPVAPTTAATKNQSEKPVVVVKPQNEILTTEEGKQLLEASIAEMEQYCTAQKEKADLMLENKQNEIDRAVAEAVEKKKREMKQEIEDAEKEAKRIVDDAKKEAKEQLEFLKTRQKELDDKSEEYTRQIAALESRKVTYKQEMLDSIKSEMEVIASEKSKLEVEIDNLKKDIRKKNIDIAALEEDKAFYEEQLATTAVKKSELLAYKTRIDELQANYEQLEKLYKEQQDELKKIAGQILLYGDDPRKALKDNAELQRKIKELQDLISNCPSAEELVKLRETSKKFEEVSNKLEKANEEKLRLEAENNDLKVSKDEIESYRKFIKILELQKAELQRELDRNIELYNNSTEKVFACLSEIDKTTDVVYDADQVTLKELCDRFRKFLANRHENPLYYDERTIRTFIAGFASSRLMILEGMSGTGKSSLPLAFKDFLLGAKTLKVEVQSSWKDRNDLLGFYNDFKKQYKETTFLKYLYQATHDPDNIYIILLDEMNLSRIEYYFADFISVLQEPIDEWKIELISDYASVSQNQDAWPKCIHEGKLQICDNTWFVGTANNDDSTQMITDKVYDRAVVLSFDKKGEKFEIESSRPIKMNNNSFQRLLRAASKFKNPVDEAKFHTIINDLDNWVIELFQITFGNRISIQLETFIPVYIECGGTVEEAIDIMFSRKILRKLEGVYDEETKLNLDVLKDEIKRKYKMPITIAAIEKMVSKIR